jgi:adenylate cyclase
VNGDSVPLESIMSCFQGVIPSPFATCSADGIPNVTHMSIVHYVDSERVALSRQFFNKSRANLDANPRSQVRVVDPQTGQDYALDLRYLHTETEGAIFAAMRSNLEAVASQSGAESIFRLRGVDIHRVERCVAVGEVVPAPTRADDAGDQLRLLDDYVRRLASTTEYGEAARTALEALEDLFGFVHSSLLVADERGDRLFGVASNGYRSSSAGAEVLTGEGVIGVAAERRHLVSIPSLARSRVMRIAVQESAGHGTAGSPAPDIALPGLESAQSVAAVPLVVHGGLVGILYLESEQAGRFGPHNERLLRILGGHLAAALSTLGRDRQESELIEPRPSAPPPTSTEDAATVTYYQADDSLFVDGEYVIKGVPGRLLWKMLREHAAEGRTAFTNRELRLDESLGLPVGNDNLEARLLVLRRRLESGDLGIVLERVGRGQLLLSVTRPLSLQEVATSGPMSASHDPDQAG